jgi:hypothetical protein
MKFHSSRVSGLAGVPRGIGLPSLQKQSVRLRDSWALHWETLDRAPRKRPLG